MNARLQPEVAEVVLEARRHDRLVDGYTYPTYDVRVVRQENGGTYCCAAFAERKLAEHVEENRLVVGGGCDGRDCYCEPMPMAFCPACGTPVRLRVVEHTRDALKPVERVVRTLERVTEKVE